MPKERYLEISFWKKLIDFSTFQGLTNGSSSSMNGKPEVVYYSPKGHTVRNKSDMARVLGNQYDLTAFDFQVTFSNKKKKPLMTISNNSQKIFHIFKNRNRNYQKPARNLRSKEYT